jgi:hypothetical protein
MPNYEKLYNLTDDDGRTLGSKFVPKGKSVGLTLPEFAKVYFSDAAGVEKLYKAIDSYRSKAPSSVFAKVLSPDVKQFFKDYACDLTWAASNAYCGNSKGYDANDYVGSYTETKTNAPIQISMDSDNELKIIMFGHSAQLLHTTDENFSILFDLKITNIAVSLNFDKNTDGNVTGFHYKMDKLSELVKKYLPPNITTEGEAKKDTVKNSNTTSSTNSHEWDYFKGISGSPYPVYSNKKNKDQDIGIPKQKVLHSEKVIVPMPANIHDCDENAYNWEIGCKNDKIKEINNKILHKELGGVYTETLKNVLINKGFMSGSETNISKNIYDDIMSFQDLHESIVKKIVIKNLRELLNKNM